MGGRGGTGVGGALNTVDYTTGFLHQMYTTIMLSVIIVI